MRSPAKVRWVTPELGELKRAADEAGVEFREAKRRCYTSKFQYYFNLQILKLKPIEQVFYVPSPERIAQVQAEAVGRVQYWDDQRQVASVALEAAKLKLDKAIWKYKEAKSRTVRHHES